MTAAAVPSVQRPIVQTRYGAARDVLALAENMPVRVPGEREVQVRVRASGGVGHCLVQLAHAVDAFVEGRSARVRIARTFPLTVEGVNAATDESRSGRTAGKLVLTR